MSDLIRSTPCIVTPAFALRASGEGAAAGELPKRIKILDWGENKGRTTGARLLVGAATLAILTANQERAAHEIVELDYEHQSVKSHPNYKEAPRHSAGHGAIECIEGEGIYLSVSDYTPNGEEHAPSYKDVSGVVHTDPGGNVILVRSVALTQNGDVAGMEFSEHVAALAAQDPSTHQPTTQPTNKTMEDKNKDKYRALLITILGLTPAEGSTEVSDEQITAAAETAGEQIALAATLAEKPKPDPANKDDDPIVALNARLDKQDKDRLVDKATALGKVIPLSAEDIEKTPITVLSAMIEKLPAGAVPTKTEVNNTEIPSGDVALSADEQSICKQLGVTEEDYKKSKTA